MKLHNPAPIFVAADEREACKSLKGAQSYDRSRLYYVITYSEKFNSYCLAVYAAAIAGSPPEQVITLLPTTGKNYGAPLAEAAKVVRVGHSSETYANAHLFSLLHWRAQPDKYISTLPQGIQAATTAVGLPTGETVPVNLLELRPEIAKSHDLTNLVLLNGLCLAGVLLIALLARLRVAYKQFERECLIYAQHIGWWEFLLRDLNRVFAEVQELYYRKQGESRQQTRAQAILRRSRDEVTSKLEGLLLSSLPGSEKDRIRNALEKEDLEEMKRLVAGATSPATSQPTRAAFAGVA